MKPRFASTLATAALCAAPFAVQAEVLQFNADLLSSQENPPISNAPGTGSAALFYNTFDTPALTDDKYSFVMWATGLTSDLTGFHIHGGATATENAPIRVDLSNAPFTSNQDAGGTLIVTGFDVPTLDIPATDAVTAGTGNPNGNAGHPAMSFLDMLRAQLGYVNVHTSLNPTGEIRGQLLSLSPVVPPPIPEPTTYALLLAGLGMVSIMVRRRQARPIAH